MSYAALLMIGAVAFAAPQSGTLVFESTAKDTNKLVVAGTSSLHDWEVVTEQIVGTLEIAADKAALDSLGLKAIQPVAAEVSIPVETLESGKGGMDKKMFKALETKTHKAATFVLDSLQPAEATPEQAANSIAVLAKGKLTITGETRWIQFPATIAWDAAAKSVKVTGSVDMRMTDFKIDPPTALLGTLKTGDEITVSFEWTPKLK